MSNQPMSDPQRKAMGALQAVVTAAGEANRPNAWHDQWKAAARVVEEYITTSCQPVFVPLAEGPKVKPLQKPKRKR